MQNAGQHYGQGGASSHQGATYGHTESSQTASGSITSSLRQFRKKDVDKQQVNDNSTTVAESHVARVAPHNHYPPRSQDCYRYPAQFPDYSLPSQVKYSEISDHQPLQEQISPSVIQKAKGKEYMEMCNMPQPHMKQGYPELNNQQPYGSDPNLHHHPQYLQKDPQVHPAYKPESQYYPKEAQYPQLPHQMQKYNMPPQMRKYPTENDFLSKLRRIHPTMARSIMSDHHLQEAQSSYQPMDQNRMFPHQNQRYMNYSAPIQSNPYPHGYMPPQPYTNYPPSCSYTRSPQMPPRFPSTNPHERSLSPRRSYSETLSIPPINYPGMPQRISPNYPQYNTPEYAQHYQHRRGPMPPQEFYPQPCRTTQYLSHQIPQPEMTENRVTVSDSIKQYIENWADEETATEMNQIETNRLCKENLRGREEQSTETVYMINASELQYLENGIPVVTSENAIPLVTSENGQYFLKSGVTIDNSTGMVRIVEKPNQVESAEGTVDRVVNLHIMDPLKPDCMLANKSNELNQRQNENVCDVNNKPRVLIHQNTVIQSSQVNVPKQTELSTEVQQLQTKVASSLPVLTENPTTTNINPTENVFTECKKETVDKNCSPINMEQMEKLDDDFDGNASVICPLKLLEHSDEAQEETDAENANRSDSKLKNMPIIDLLSEGLHSTPEEDKVEEEKAIDNHENQTERDRKEDSFIKEDAKCEVKEETLSLTIGVIDTENSSCNDTNEEKDIKSANGNIEPDEIIENIKKENDENVMKEPNEETKEITTESAKEIGNKEKISETVVEMSKNDSPGSKNNTLNTLDIKSTIIIEDYQERGDNIQDCNTTEENQSVIVPGQTVTPKEKNDAKINDTASSSKCSEIKPSELFTDAVFSEQKIDKPTCRRAKRIFSVDDIINNIGNNINKSKPNTLLTERRRSLQITREFLEKEIDASPVFPSKSTTLNEPLLDICEEKNKEEADDDVEMTEGEQANEIEEVVAGEDKKPEQTEERNDNVAVVEEPDKSVKIEDALTAENVEEKAVIKEEDENEDTMEKKTSELENLETADKQVSEKETMASVENVVKPVDEKLINEKVCDQIEETNEKKMDPILDPKEEDIVLESNVSNNETKLSTVTTDENVINNILDEQEVTNEKSEIPNSLDNTDSVDTSQEAPLDLDIKELDTDITAQNEVQYRNAIRVDENNVLLEIAGELVEITVSIVNGKKVITVLPLSESTVLDFNDNYETLDTTHVHDPTKSNSNDGERTLEMSQLLSGDEVPAEPDIIESTSEIIIGLDISLEEEVQLDLEKPQSLSTKASKKLYENDLQIPSITTSEDITDNNKTKSYSPNDKVSSSKEQTPEKSKNEKKKVSKSENSSKKSSSGKKKLKQVDSDRSVVKELMKIRKVKKETSQQSKEEEEEEEFVPFKDLIKARKLKKMKLLQMKTDDNVSADSTNRLDQEECSELESELKEDCKKHKYKEMVLFEINEESTLEEKSIEIFNDAKDESVEFVDKSSEISKTKDREAQNKTKKSKVEEKEKCDEMKHVEHTPKLNISIGKKKVIENIAEKTIKKVTFGTVSYSEPDKSSDKFSSEIKNYKLEDPRIRSRVNGGILVPSVSELLRENDRLANSKKKLSLAEYNNRKRKLAGNHEERELKIRKNSSENGPTDVQTTFNTKIEKRPKEEPLNRIKIPRPKSLDDIKIFGKPKDSSLVKRKFSLEMSNSKPNYFDWEETQSPKTNLNSQEDSQKRLSEFRGLINNNKSKIVVDVSDLKLATSEGSEDEILQNYKEQVDSKLSSLNLQIPRVAKPPASIANPFSNAETITLMQRFLRNEKLSSEEMEKIKKIISYKRLMQQLDRIKSPGLNSSPLNPSYEIRKACTEKEMKLHLKKVPEKKKRRFRNLYTESTSESDSDFSDNKRNNGDYSVVQSNCYAAGVPKLIIKRKTEMPLPVVRLERLDLNMLANRKRKFC